MSISANAAAVGATLATGFVILDKAISDIDAEGIDAEGFQVDAIQFSGPRTDEMYELTFDGSELTIREIDVPGYVPGVVYDISVAASDSR